MELLRVAVAGLGRIGRLHAQLLHSFTQRSRLVAVMDVIEELARSVGERLGVPWYTDFSRMLDRREIDAVVIATPTFLHREMTAAALEAGVHVLVEKPLAQNTSEARDIVERSRSSGLKLQVGYMRRFDEAFRRAKRAVEEGVVGKPLSYVAIARDPAPPKGWVVDPSKSGGIFMDMLSHDTDMARWLMGDEVARVFARGSAGLVEHIREAGDLDFAEVLLEFREGAYGFVQGIRVNPPGYDLRTEVYGTKGTVYVDNRIDNTSALATSGGIVFTGVSWFEKRFLHAYIEELDAFAESIQEDKKPPVDAVDGYRVVAIGEACWESLRRKKPVDVAYEL